MYEDEDNPEGVDFENFDMQFGECYFPGECCMPGLHYPMECFTAEMAMEEQRYYEMLEREEKYPILRLTKRALDWLRGLANLFVLRKKVVVDDEVPF